MRYLDLLLGNKPNMVLFKMRYPRRKLTKDEVFMLKDAIGHRLDTEDYTCRLPKLPKPRVRYKLSTVCLLKYNHNNDPLEMQTYWK